MRGKMRFLRGKGRNMKRTILEKLRSRKLWVAVIGIIVGIASAFGIDASEWTQIAGIITSAVSVAAYVIGEARIDAAGVSGKDGDED